MKRFFFLALSIPLLIFACQNKQQADKTLEAEVKQTEVKLTNIIFSAMPDSIDYMKLPRLTKNEYKELQLAKVKELNDYDIRYLAMGKTLFSNEYGKLVTIYLITDGEIAEYLLSYDQKGMLVDNVLVAYEDMIEYYTQVASKIDSSQLTIQTVNFTYEYQEESGDEKETCDTITSKYIISPEFKFIAS